MRTACSFHSGPARSKMASIYWAKFGPGNDREAWKQRWCKPCFQEFFGPWYRSELDAYLDGGTVHCLYCDESNPNNLQPFFATAYLPGHEKESLDVEVCLSHLPNFEESIRRGAVALQDRQLVSSQNGRSDDW